VKRASFAAITLLVLLGACSPATEVTSPLDDAISEYSPDQTLPTSTAQPTATSVVATETPLTAGTDELPEETPAEAATGEISVLISNGTLGAEIPEGLPVTLYGVSGQTMVFEIEGEAGETGEFVFEDIAMAEGMLYGVVAEHQGVSYFSDAESMPVNLETLELPITIYNITQDPALVSVEQLHVLFEFNVPGAVSVLEVWVISNTGDRTFAPSEGGIEIILPDGASALRFSEGGLGDRYLITETGFIDLAPVRPGVGGTQLLFTFDLPYERRLDFSQRMNYPVQAADVLLPEGGPVIREGDLLDSGSRQVSSGTLHTYSADPIASGEALEFRITGRLPGAAAGDLTPQMGMVIGGVVLGIVLIGIGLWWYRFGGRPSTAKPRIEENDILQAIAELDDEHAAGKISDSEHSQRREELKQQAIELMQTDHD
jgi:hypothetical protein